MSRFAQRTLRTGLVVAAALVALACDPDGKKSCDWTLEPEPSMEDKVDAGFIPVCARNRKSMKEDCRLQTSLEYAKKVFGRKFRYVDLRVESPGLPRTVSEIKFCDGRG